MSELSVTVFDSSQAFFEALKDFLADQEENTLVVSVAAQQQEDTIYASVNADDSTVLAGIFTPSNPHLTTLASPPAALSIAPSILDQAVALLVDTLLPFAPLAAVGGMREQTELFARRYCAARGLVCKLAMAQQNFRLNTVNWANAPAPLLPHKVVLATEEHADMLTPHFKGFMQEVFGSASDETVRRQVESSFNGKRPLYLLMIQPSGSDAFVFASFCGVTCRTDTVCRLGMVWTPLEHRRHGYAAFIVAHTTQRLLDQGVKWCTLLTDQANPVSNSMYRKIGYQATREFAMFECRQEESDATKKQSF